MEMYRISLKVTCFLAKLKPVWTCKRYDRGGFLRNLQAKSLIIVQINLVLSENSLHFGGIGKFWRYDANSFLSLNYHLIGVVENTQARILYR